MTRLRTVALAFLFVFLVGTACSTSAQVPSADYQTASAVVPLPEDRRADARILGYDEDGRVVPVREGSNEMICVADRPGDDEFHAACYHRALEPFMSRGRELRAEGYGRTEVDSIRRAEVEEGVWSMPDHPASLFSVSGSAEDWNASTQELEGAGTLYVVYTPYETEESTGLPTQPVGGGPWLMESGTPWAHIMMRVGE